MLADDLGAKSARQTVEIKVDQVEDSSITRVTSSPNEVRRVILHRKRRRWEVQVFRKGTPINFFRRLSKNLVPINQRIITKPKRILLYLPLPPSCSRSRRTIFFDTPFSSGQNETFNCLLLQKPMTAIFSAMKCLLLLLFGLNASSGFQAKSAWVPIKQHHLGSIVPRTIPKIALLPQVKYASTPAKSLYMNTESSEDSQPEKKGFLHKVC